MLLLVLLPVLGRLLVGGLVVVAVLVGVEALAIDEATTGEGLGVGWIFGWDAAGTAGWTAC